MQPSVTMQVVQMLLWIHRQQGDDGGRSSRKDFILSAKHRARGDRYGDF
jgi:hypothetical protein